MTWGGSKIWSFGSREETETSEDLSLGGLEAKAAMQLRQPLYLKFLYCCEWIRESREADHPTGSLALSATEASAPEGFLRGVEIRREGWCTIS